MGCITLQRPIFHFALYYPWELSFCQRILCGNENVTHSAQSELSGRNDFFGGNFLFRISEYRRSEEVDFHFANYRFSFRKQQIFISQTTDSHFANYRFSFRFAPFRFANYSEPKTWHRCCRQGKDQQWVLYDEWFMKHSETTSCDHIWNTAVMRI